MYIFCVAVINKQKCCFVRKNSIASKRKKQYFLSSTISGKRIQGQKICLKQARNQQKIMLILVITQCYQREMFNILFPKAEAVAQRCFVKKLFLEISQNLQENASTINILLQLFLVFLQFYGFPYFQDGFPGNFNST